MIDGAVVSDAILMSSRFYYAIFIMPNGIIKMKSIVLKNIRSTFKLPQNVHSKDLKQNRSGRVIHPDLNVLLEPTAGLEPATYALRVRCSTN